MLFIVAHRLIKCPMRVKKRLLTIWPNALGTKNNPSIAPLATTLHLTRAETERAMSESKTIHAIEPKKTPHAIHRFDHIQPKPVSDD